MNTTLAATAFFVVAWTAAPVAFAADAPPATAPLPMPQPERRVPPVPQTVDVGWWCSEPTACAPCPTTCVRDPLFRIPCLDDCVDSFEKGKESSCFKLGAFAYHWLNLQNRDDRDLTYGYPSAKGTYFYGFTADLDCCSSGAPIGFHAQLRARDESTFRSFMDDQTWFYEIYAKLQIGGGTLKAGKIWKRFGLDWDGTFWGNVPYYDGMKLDPDFGASFERTFKPNKRLSVAAIGQWFAAEDGVNGSLAGADAESVTGFQERNTFVARVVPTLALDDHWKVSVGLSALAGTIRHNSVLGSDETLTQWAVDATVERCGLKAFAEYTYSDGEQNPAHYVTGGPSDVYATWTLGAEWKIGPFMPRVVFSHGDYENPDGSQDILVAGGTIELTKYLTLYLEYVKWDVDPDVGASSVFEDGFQFILNWHI